jgi:antitoxin VapB
MKTAQVINVGGEQAIKLPREFQVSGETVSIRKDGDAIILEPVKAANWPEGFFEQIRVDDPAFARPPQGSMPPAPSLP